MKYVVLGSVTISVTVEVEADSEGAAKEAALALPLPALCHMCTSMGNDPEDECWCVDELDGEPRVDSVEEAP